MPRKTKDQIANDTYGDDYEYLTPGEKAAVSRAFNTQSTARARPATRASPAAFSCHIGRVGVNGTKNCLMVPGSTVSDLINQASYTLDSKKETVVAQSTGTKVLSTTGVVDGETYVITPEIKSA